MQHLIIQRFDLIDIKLDEALATGAWSLWVSFLAPSKVLEARASLGHGPPWTGMNTAQDTEGAIRTMKWCGRKSQELTNQHPSCLCPEHYRHSNGGFMKSVKSVLEVFVIKLNVAGYNILKKTFDLSWEALQPVRYKKTSQLSIKGHRNVVWAVAAQFDAAVVQSFRCFRPSTEFILK